MSHRKPGNVSWDEWTEAQIKDAQRYGQLDNLQGKGKPLSKIGAHYDENWWVKQKIKNEKLDATPITLRVRAKAEKWLMTYKDLPTERRVRLEAEALNKEIAGANKTNLGPLLPQNLLDIESLCSVWRKNV